MNDHHFWKILISQLRQVARKYKKDAGFDMSGVSSTVHDTLDKIAEAISLTITEIESGNK